MTQFAFELALAFGILDVEGMLRSMTAEQFVDWQIFYDVQGFGEKRKDERAGLMPSLYLQRNTKRGTRRTEPLDFFRKGRRIQRQSTAEMQAELSRVDSRMGRSGNSKR